MTHTHIVWSLVHDSDSGTATFLFGSEAELDSKAALIMEEDWAACNRKQPMPADWREAWEIIQSDGCDFWISTDTHEVVFP